jgi:hypothetical protein
VKKLLTEGSTPLKSQRLVLTVSQPVGSPGKKRKARVGSEALPLIQSWEGRRPNITRDDTGGGNTSTPMPIKFLENVILLKRV